MTSILEIKDKLFNISTPEEFNAISLEIFQFQYNSIEVYRRYIDAVHLQPERVITAEQIPFLPIEFFKHHVVVSGKYKPEFIFISSTTTGSQPSQHYVSDGSLYQASLLQSFKYWYGHPDNYAILALLPSYLERKGSSLVFMMEQLMKLSGHATCGFYLHDLEKLAITLKQLEDQSQPVILVGVSFALLDYIEKFESHLPHLIIMETGGMKGRRKELTREELHKRLSQGFGTMIIHSEYGMTELLSQAYSPGHGLFRCPPWMKVLIRDVNDPLSLVGNDTAGGINVIDLANLYSCSFIATDDLGLTHEDGTFEVLGRLDTGDIRGCNLMIP